MRTGDIDAYHEFANADLDLCRGASMPWISASYVYLGLVDFWRGRWEQALESLQEATSLEVPGGLAGQEWSRLFVAKAHAGPRSEALAMLHQRADELPRSGQPNALGAWLMLFAAIEGLAVLGQRDECAKLYPLALEAVNAGAVFTWWPGSSLQMIAGIAAACGGQWERAEEHFETALRQAHELPNVLAQPETRRWYAWMLLDRDGPGDRDQARTLLGEAIAMYRQIGMPKHVEIAEALLQRASAETAP
jgi:tetratricopeptide (TPR) repeat protein